MKDAAQIIHIPVNDNVLGEIQGPAHCFIIIQPFDNSEWFLRNPHFLSVSISDAELYIGTENDIIQKNKPKQIKHILSFAEMSLATAP